MRDTSFFSKTLDRLLQPESIIGSVERFWQLDAMDCFALRALAILKHEKESFKWTKTYKRK